MESKKKSKNLVLSIIIILVVISILCYIGLVIYRMARINVIADRVEKLMDLTDETNYRIEELYTISNINVEKTKGSYNKEFYSFGLDKMMIDKKENSEQLYITVGDKYFESYKTETKEYKEIPTVEFDNNEYFAITSTNIYVYNLIKENMNMTTFVEKLKLAANLFYNISSYNYEIRKEKGNVAINLTAAENDKIYFSIYEYDQNIKANYEAYIWRIDLNIVKDYMMQKPDVSEYALVNE